MGRLGGVWLLLTRMEYHDLVAGTAYEVPRKPKFERDFIMLSEFSELVGPVPVVSLHITHCCLLVAMCLVALCFFLVVLWLATIARYTHTQQQPTTWGLLSEQE